MQSRGWGREAASPRRTWRRSTARTFTVAFVPAGMPYDLRFTACWFALSAAAGRHLTEQRRNSAVVDGPSPAASSPLGQEAGIVRAIVVPSDDFDLCVPVL